MDFVRAKLPRILKYSDSESEINNLIKANQEKYEKIRKNEMDLFSKRNILVENKVKKIDEDINKLRKSHKYSYSNISKIDQTSATPCLSLVKNTSTKHLISYDENHEVSTKIVQSRINTKPKIKLKKNILKLRENNNSNLDNFEPKKDFSNFPNISFIEATQQRSIVKKKNLNKVESNNSIDSFEREDSKKDKHLYKQNRGKRDILCKIDKKDPNYKKIQDLKNYDNLVCNLAHVKGILYKIDKCEDQSFCSKTELNGSFQQTTARNDGSIVNLLSKMNNLTNVNKSTNSEKGMKNRSLTKIFNSNNVPKVKSVDTSANKQLNPDSLLEKEIRPVVVDRYKAKLNKIYKLNTNYMEEINKVKQTKNLSLEEYQKKLIEVAAKYISGDSISNLSANFNLIKEQNNLEIKEKEVDCEEQLNQLKLEIEIAEIQDFKNLKEKKPKENEIKIKKRFVKKRKIDESMKKLGQYLPSELFEKLKAI